MQNKDFDKFFADNLQNELDFDYRDADWQAVAGQLYASKSIPVNWLKWLIPVIWLSLLGGMGYLIYRLDQTNNNLDNLKKELAIQNKQALKTVVKKEVEIRVDTVYLTRTIFKNNTHDISVNGTAGLGTSTFSPFFFPSDIGEQWGNELTTKLAENSAFQSYLPSQNNHTKALAENFNNTIFSSTNQLIQFGKGLVSLPISEKELLVEFPKESSLALARNVKWRYYFMPQGFKAGVSAGKSFIPTGDLSSITVNNFGLKSEIQFIKNISLVAGFDWYQLRYLTSNSMDVGGDIPLPTEEEFGELLLDDIVFARTDQRFQQIKIGLKYDFVTDGKVTPYLGINYLSSINFKKDFSYRFESPNIPNGGTEIDISRTASNYHLNGFGLDAGVEVQLKEHLGLQLEGYYHFINQNAASQYYDLTGLRASLLYRFGER